MRPLMCCRRSLSWPGPRSRPCLLGLPTECVVCWRVVQFCITVLRFVHYAGMFDQDLNCREGLNPDCND